MKKKLIFVSLLISILLIGCGSDGGSDTSTTDTSTKISRMDLSNANSLIIAPTNNSIATKTIKSTSTNSDELLKITEDGIIQEVTYLNENNETITNVENPVYIGNINSDYLIVAFGFDLNNVQTTYIVQKSDGKIYDIEEKLYFTNNSTFIPTLFQSYGSNTNLYIPVSTDINNMIFSKILKLDVSNFDNITKEFILPEGDNLNQGFVMDDNGNSIYYGRKDAVSEGYSRILKGDGSIENIDKAFFYWKGLDGKLYSKPVSSYNIIKHDIDAAYNYSESNITIPTDVLFNMDWYSYQIRTSIAIIFTHSDGRLTEVYNSSQTPRNITSDLTSVKSVDQSDNYYYIVGNNNDNDPVLRKFSSSDDSYVDLLIAGEYDIYSFSVSSDDDIMFNALRMSDSKKVIGKISSTGTVTILDDTSNVELSNIENI